MSFKERVTSKTPTFFNWLKGIAITLASLCGVLATIATDEGIFGITFLNSANLTILAIVFGVITGTYHMAKKE